MMTKAIAFQQQKVMKNRQHLRGAQSSDARVRVLIIGDASSDDNRVGSLLQQYDITPSFTAVAEPNCNPAPSPDLVVLNLSSLTAASPSKVCEARAYRAPVLCTIPREDVAESLLLSKLPTDDYILRPFPLEEFLCRVQALLWRSRNAKSSPMVEKRRLMRRQSDLLSDGQGQEKGRSERPNIPFMINDRGKVVIIGGREIRLTPREYELLVLLASEPGRVYSSEQIIAHIWVSAGRASLGDVQQYIHLLRKKIECDPKHPKWIVTVDGFGYKLKIPTEE
jgi:DNA-binding response OmpR family regulator